MDKEESDIMESVDIKLGFQCNNRCLFCVQGDKRSQYGPRPIQRIRRDLSEGRSRGAAKIVLTGGEPTLHPTLLETVRIAKGLGYGIIQVQSNGRRFFYEDFCRELIEAGANEFSPALHGSTAFIHDSLTQAPGSFRQTVGGIRNLKRLGQFVVTNTVVTKGNYRDLAALARLFVALGVDQFQFAFVHILGTAEQNKKEIVPSKSAVMPYVREGLEIGRRSGVRCFTEAIPYCLMAGYEECVAERIIPRALVYDADHTEQDYTAYRRNTGKAKGPRCAQCLYYKQCEGPWKEYPPMFGWEEFQPVQCPIRSLHDF